MRYVFFGTPRFAAIVLEHLLDAEMPPVALVCNPDRPIGRKKVIAAPATKDVIASHNAKKGDNIAILQPENFDAAFTEGLASLNPDFFVVAAFSKIIPVHILDLPRLGTIGTHPSLLPSYRGASPIQSAIIEGEKETGVTLYLMDAGMDSGPALAQERLAIKEGDNYPRLEEKLADLAGTMLVRTIPELTAGKITPQPQDTSRATFTKKFTTADGFIPEEELSAAEKGDNKKARIVFQKILALDPEPGAWTLRNGKRVKLLEARIENNGIRLIKIQEEGGKPKTM